ncbi:hypothetical protein ACFSJI_32685, partial [Streptomyces calvus]
MPADHRHSRGATLSMSTTPETLRWYGDGYPSTDPAGIHQALTRVEQPCFIVSTAQGAGAAAGGTAAAGG